MSTNLHTLAVNLAAMQRLLGRRTADGTIVPADPALIEAAVTAGRAQVAGIRTLLRDIPHDPMDPWRGSVDELIAAVGELDGLLDRLERMLSQMGS
ncbi:hypothetical protein MKL09_29650 [Methylobacterium sp. J-048]|uniref:hypothetical protein n=1 Tax=unclassified Methylobacterium TaxID=2615210 RepID=UPI001FBC0A3A|nr:MULTISPECIES: hypothetical protein [unclassified Methylobacterium]MCJ2060672.1 hypothetical protein [Methylobacterium sp. J-048]MCJ2139116.1 hypothetical protein [Methylobacterium sp. E-066]